MTNITLENKLENSLLELHEDLESVLQDKFGSKSQLVDLTKLSAGASREVWSFNLVAASGSSLPLILKRDPVYEGIRKFSGMDPPILGIDRTTEAKLMDAAEKYGVRTPRVHLILEPSPRRTSGFIMDRIEGETLGNRIVRNDKFKEARKKLAYQCGESLAQIHSVPIEKLPALRNLVPRKHLELYRNTLRTIDYPYPGFEYGIRWLEERLELAADLNTLTHGDFRNGNLVIGANGLRSVLDWELGHLGDPACDLGWLCVKSWRFGKADHAVGGFGHREDLINGYESAGGDKIDIERFNFWEIFGTMRWGIMCILFAFNHIGGRQRSIEAATIGRRAAETENDLLRLID